MSEKKQIEKFKADHPVCCSFHTGKYGFHRYLDGFDLSRCIYTSKRSAEMARAVAARQYVALRDYCEKETQEFIASQPEGRS